MDYLVAMQKFLTYDDVPHIKKYIKTNQWWDTIDGLITEVFTTNLQAKFLPEKHKNE